MPKRFNPYTRKMQTVSSAVSYAGRKGKKRNSYCKRTAKIGGSWKTNPKSKNLLQRRAWGCSYIKGELKVSDYRRGRY